MDTASKTYAIDFPQKVSKKTEAIFLILSAVLLVWDFVSGDSVNLFFAAFVIGSAMTFALRLLGASIVYQVRAFAVPLVIVAGYGVLVDDRIWLVPVWLFIVLLFGFGILVIRGSVNLEQDHLSLPTLGFHRKIPYSEIERIERRSDSQWDIGSKWDLTVIIRHPKRTLLWRSPKLPVPISEADVPDFLAELGHRTGNADLRVTTAGLGPPPDPSPTALRS